MKRIYLILLITQIITSNLFSHKKEDCTEYWQCLEKNGLKNCSLPECAKKSQKCLDNLEVCENCYKKVEGNTSPYYCDIIRD